MPTVLEEYAELPDRIKASAERVEDLTAQLADERRRRDALIVQAIDQAGIPQRQIAAAAHLSQPHLIRILAASS